MAVRQNVQRHVADDFLRKFHLIERLQVHEYELAVLLVQVFHLAAVEVDLLNFFTGAEALLQNGAVVQIPDGDLDESAKVSGRSVLQPGNEVQLVVNLDTHVGLQFGRLHAECS